MLIQSSQVKLQPSVNYVSVGCVKEPIDALSLFSKAPELAQDSWARPEASGTVGQTRSSKL